MTRFVIYLFETGLCLSLLYLAYWLFLRKETYFNFNRLFLVGSIVLALSLPLVHLNFMIRQESSMEESASSILKFRNYYQELIGMIEADYGYEPGVRHSSGATGGTNATGEMVEGLGEESALRMDTENEPVGTKNAGSPLRIPAMFLLLVYLAGVAWFLVRFIYLVTRLFFLARKYGYTDLSGFRMVTMEEDISPFSFFRYLYINKSALSEEELHNILEHEKAHISQRHSLDHLFAHALAVFQWFNPFAWQIRNALKTTHEFIADRQVLNRGFALVDYQTLLLRQVIGYHSVELVNNFNLKPIKKRIAMMTKIRSGRPARLKAILVIPFAIFLFLLFADFTVKGPDDQTMNLQTLVKQQKMAIQLEGLWKKTGQDEAAKILLFKGSNVSILENGSGIREYFWRTDGEQIILSGQKDGLGTTLKFSGNNKQMQIWWNDLGGTAYQKTAFDNTMDLFLEKQGMKIELPMISKYRILEKQDLVYKICLGFDKGGSVTLTFNNEKISMDQLGDKVNAERAKHNKLDVNKLTGVLYADENMPMKEVADLRQLLREINALKLADAGYPHKSGMEVSPVLYHTIALPRLLPPLDAKIMDKEEVEKIGTALFIIDLSAKNSTPADVHKGLTEHIKQYDRDRGKYVFSLEYDGEIPYGQYIEAVDMIFSVVYEFRDKLAMKEHGVSYTELGPDLQKKIRKVYPMALSEAWSGV
jgi:biopolymer transport protein ExbD